MIAYTRRYREDYPVPEYLHRILTAWPLSVYEYQTDSWRFIWTRQYWWISWWFIVSPVFRFLIRIRCWEIENGAYYISGKWRWFNGKGIIRR